MNNLILKEDFGVFESLQNKIKERLDPIKKEILEFSKKYKDLIVTDENLEKMQSLYREAKKKLKEIDIARKETENIYNKPILFFKDEIKQIKEDYEKQISDLERQINNYEIKRKEDLQIKINEKINFLFIEFKLSENYRNFIIAEKYFNKTQTWKETEKDLIDQAIRLSENQIRDIQILQIKQEKKSLIESLFIIKNKDLNNPISLNNYLELMNDDISISQIPIRVNSIFESKKAEEEIILKKAKQKEEEIIRLEEIKRKAEEEIIKEKSEINITQEIEKIYEISCAFTINIKAKNKQEAEQKIYSNILKWEDINIIEIKEK